MATTIRPGATVKKDPEAQLIYRFDWSAELGDLDIDSSVWTVIGEDEELVVDSESIDAGLKITEARLSFGTLGETYRVENKITMSGSPTQVDERSFKIRIKEL